MERGAAVMTASAGRTRRISRFSEALGRCVDMSAAEPGDWLWCALYGVVLIGFIAWAQATETSVVLAAGTHFPANGFAVSKWAAYLDELAVACYGVLLVLWPLLRRAKPIRVVISVIGLTAVAGALGAEVYERSLIDPRVHLPGPLYWKGVSATLLLVPAFFLGFAQFLRAATAER